MLKQLWLMTNVITGFAVVQAVATAFALATSLRDLQLKEIRVKTCVAMVAVATAALYCIGVWACWWLAWDVEANKTNLWIWTIVTIGETLAILFFTGVAIGGLFAPELEANVKPPPQTSEHASASAPAQQPK